MSTEELRHAQLVAWLEDQGHDADAIEKILDKVAEYDDRMVHESVFDSIDAGKFNLQSIIDEALGKD
ncbi:hypothetical protein Pla175_32320 [Pirellulimonas nuda]|uniref:Uncharacterized protein n=1 Tax=Pirellulimonas nuda TaxID=2528009 RepID=A0A518DEE9_9BACT|nr:hypothetical protein [Pirellulimonas nuda]QDU89836.1 hypothetical protein Pla175_32320 [Pirellulimonas nuda]